MVSEEMSLKAIADDPQLTSSSHNGSHEHFMLRWAKKSSICMTVQLDINKFNLELSKISYIICVVRQALLSFE